MALFTARGKCSRFGGPEDTGVAADEGLAFFYDYDDAPHLFLDAQPAGTTGLARRLNPYKPYIACRWDYDVTPKDMLRQRNMLALVSAKGRSFQAWPADWGPAEWTERVADLSPALMELLGLGTDDEVEISYPVQQEEVRLKIAISSGHGRLVRGASGEFDEVTEARVVVEALANVLEDLNTDTQTWHDNVSDDQSENLNRIVDWHNDTAFNGGAYSWAISVHFNAYDTHAHGTEVLYVTQEDMANRMSAAIAAAGHFTNRGGKYRSDLAFLNGTREKALLLEICFCDNKGDADNYKKHFDDIIKAIANTLVGTGEVA